MRNDHSTLDGALSADPAAVGLDPQLPDRLRGEVARQRAEGLTNGAQLFVARRGDVVIDEAVGVRSSDSSPLRPDTRLAVYSAGKPVVATAVHILVERGLLTYSDPVQRHLHEFNGGGKEAITIRDCFLHLGGLPDEERKVGVGDHVDWDAAVAKICDLEVEYEPGTRVEYHPITVWTLLAEIVRRLDGREFEVFCDQEIFSPLGMKHSSWGLAPELGDAADRTMMREGDDGGDLAMRGVCVPGGSMFSTAHDLGLFYVCWRSGGMAGDVRLLSEATVAHATLRHVGRILGVDEGLGLGYGFFVGAEPSAMLSRGHLCSPRTFGHPGGVCSVAFCDPEHDLVVAFVANVGPDQFESDRRFAIMCDHVYRAIR